MSISPEVGLNGWKQREIQISRLSSLQKTPLLACDDTIKTFKSAVRDTRDDIAQNSLVNLGDT